MTVSILDGLVVARTPLHNSVNYRSVVIRGEATDTELLVEEGENEMVDARNGASGPGPLVQEEDNSSFVIIKPELIINY